VRRRDVGQFDANAQHYLAVIRHSCICGLHGLLQLDGALYRAHRSGELDQHPTAHLYDAATMFRDQRLEDGLSRSFRAVRAAAWS
jgi:hypothetical protein